MATIASWITRRPRVSGEEACVRDTNINIWGLVEWRQRGLSDSEILRAVQGLRQEDLNAAWAYYADNVEEIEEAIRSNAEA